MFSWQVLQVSAPTYNAGSLGLLYFLSWVAAGLCFSPSAFFFPGSAENNTSAEANNTASVRIGSNVNRLMRLLQRTHQCVRLNYLRFGPDSPKNPDNQGEGRAGGEIRFGLFDGRRGRS